MTVLEIAKTSGLSIFEVNSLSWLTSWDEVPFRKIRPFMEGCGIKITDRANLRSQCNYIRRGAPFKYLKKDPLWKSVYEPMILAYVGHSKA